jgi:hypothetical protein
LEEFIRFVTLLTFYDEQESLLFTTEQSRGFQEETIQQIENHCGPVTTKTRVSSMHISNFSFIGGFNSLFHFLWKMVKFGHKLISSFRKQVKIWQYSQIQRYADDNFYAFTRGCKHYNWWMIL